eukprot:scaffold173875_cov31-Tisochrysis_lutea.AAC.1
MAWCNFPCPRWASLRPPQARRPQMRLPMMMQRIQVPRRIPPNDAFEPTPKSPSIDHGCIVTARAWPGAQFQHGHLSFLFGSKRCVS